MTELATVPLLIIDDLGMRKLAHTAAEDLLELIMRRYERAATLLISNRPAASKPKEELHRQCVQPFEHTRTMDPLRRERRKADRQLQDVGATP